MQNKTVINKDYIKKGLITERTHPDDRSLKIYNYTAKTQYKGLWDETTRLARGLIVRNGQIIAMPFRKFYNLNEIEETKEENLPAETPEITVKIDGSLGILFLAPDGKLAITTRGSFTSDEAMWATNYLRKNYKLPLDIVTRYTVMFEICSPVGKHIIKYPHKLYLIGLRENVTGNLLPYSEVIKKAKELNLDVLPGFRVYSPLQDLPLHLDNIEGWVAMFPKNQLLVKIKTEKYRTLARYYQAITFNNILDLMTSGQYDDVILRLPAELRREAERIKDKIMYFYDEIYNEATEYYRELPAGSRKKKALWIQKNIPPALQAIIFLMLNNKDTSQLIFKRIKSEHLRENITVS